MTNMKATKRALVSSALALFLCFAMLIGTTFAWFTDKVESKNNIIKAGNLDVEFYWADGKTDPTATTTTWNDASVGPIFKGDQLWEPGYTDARHLKIVNKGSLALNYHLRIVPGDMVSKLADVIDVYYFATAQQIQRANVTALKGVEYDANNPDAAGRLGTLAEIIGGNGSKNISSIVNGMLKAGTEDTLTIVLKMREEAGNEYQGLSAAGEFSIELIATQASFEEDSFDETYDKDATSPAVPEALVKFLGGQKISYTLGIGGASYEGILDTGYQFMPTESHDEAMKSDYRYWHADFVVSADSTVPADSMMLAGYYSLFCEGFNDSHWVGLTHSSDIPANNEIRLLTDGLSGVSVNWEELCEFGNDGVGFLCGAMDMTGVNAGTTLTVELRLYETEEPSESNGNSTNVETGEYITVGTYKYTFGVNTPEKLEYALTKGGEYKLTGDIALDATSTITVPAGVETVLDLNGHTITGASVDTDKNRNMFTVKGDLTVKNGTVEMSHKGANMGWGNSVSAFSVEGGELTLDTVTVKNIGGSDMAYGIDVNTTLGESVLNINNSKIESTYTAVRIFNNHKSQTGTVNFNGGSIDGVKRDIWVQNPSASAVDANGVVNVAAGYTYDVTVQAPTSYYGRIYQFN